MSLSFVQENFTIGQKNPDIKPTFTFFRKGFRIGGSTSIDYRDIILHGNTALTLVNAKADSLEYLKLSGGCEQNGTPTPTTPIDIVCNNGAIKVSKNLFDKNNLTRIYAYFAGTGTTWSYAETGYSVRIPCLPNTTYIARYNGNQTQAVLSVASTNNDTKATSTTRLVTVTQAIRQNNPTINTPITITTANDDKWLIVQYNVADPQNTDMANNLQIEVGSTATPYMPYGQIYTEGTTETVKITGKNLFDKNTMSTQEGWYIGNNSTGEINNSPANNRAIVIDCKPNTTYSFWHTEDSGGGRAFDMPTDNITIGDFATKWLSSPLVAEKNQVTTYTTSSTAKKLYILAGRKDGTVSRPFEEQLADFMVVEGNVATATEYEQYFNGGTATAQNLFKVGTYQDVQSVIDGEVTRNIGILVLDGTENWRVASINACYIIALSTLLATGTVPCYSTHFEGGYTSLPSAADRTGKVLTYNGNLGIGYDNRQGGTENFKQWLADQYANGTPVIVIYPLATATTETVTAQPLTIQAGTNIVEITQASMDNLELEVKYKAGVAVTITEIQNAQLDNSVEVTING